MSREGVGDLTNRLKHQGVGVVSEDKVEHILLWPFVQKTTLQVDAFIPFSLDSKNRLTSIDANFFNFAERVTTRRYLNYSREANSMTATLVKVLIDGKHRTEDLLSAEVETVLGGANCYVVGVFEV